MRPSRKDTRKAGQDVAGTNLSQPWVELEEKECSCWFHWRMPDVFECGPVMLDPDPGVDTIDVAKRNATLLYQPLKPWQTRIVTILHGSPSSEPLQCNLWTADLIDKPGVAVSGTSDIVTYNALSYSWGPGKPNKVISCNNNTFLVNDSLASALEGLRQMQADVHIWCDTSCINPVEKAQQVRNMLRISRRPSTLLHGLEVPIGGPSTSSTP
jgi:hypothetical protein